MGYPPYAGTQFWDMMLNVALEYAENPTNEEKETMLQWITLTMKVFPCTPCSLNGIGYVTRFIPNVSSREFLVRYVIDFHNFVNKALGKTTFTTQEAMSAFHTRQVQNIHDVPRSIEIVRENTARIKAMQLEITSYQKQVSYYSPVLIKASLFNILVFNLTDVVLEYVGDNSFSDVII